MAPRVVALGGGQQPAAAWLTSNTEQDAEPSIDVRMGVPATGVKNDVRLCHPEGGYLGHALNSTQLVRERSSISWSKVSGSTFVTEATAVSCRSDGCTDVAGAPDAGTCTEAQRERRVLPGVQRLAQGALSSSNALDGYVVSAWSETSNSGASSVWVQMHEGNSNPNETAPLSEAWLSREDVTLGTTPADSPIVSVLDAGGGANQTEIVAVGWTQSAAEPARQLAHLRSFHLCPQP